MKRILRINLLVGFGTLLLLGCEGPKQPVSAARHDDPQVLSQGRDVFSRHCAACHGARAQGANQWQRPGADGKYLPPPLDGSGHDWHHPMSALKDVIRNGTQRIGGNMPPWRDKLSEADIDAVIAYFQSLWPAEIYQVWADIDRRSRMGLAK